MTALHREMALDDAAARQHRPTLTAALDWLMQTRDSHPVIPTLYLAAWHLERPELARRAERAAQSAVERQLPSGAVWGGVVGTGRALLGWLSAFAETGSGVFAGAARRAGRFLFATLDHDAVWRRDGAHSPHTAWALAEAGRRLGAPELRAAAAQHLRAVARLQHEDGWMPDARFPERARGLADVADAIRGLLEGGRLLADERLIALAARAAAGLAAAQARDGRLPDRFAAGWQPAGSSWCAVGQAHMANVWLRLCQITGARVWLEPVRPVLRALTSTPRREGEITATKFLVDALIRDERIARGLVGETTAGLVLA
ncbi:MAG TPA: hypothetical protein VIV88_02135 [Gemmatimonadales bacterium]